MLFSLLTESTTPTTNNAWMTYVLLGVLVVALIAMFVVSSRRNKKRQQEAEKLINSVRPGNKVKTIGGVCGIVVEVDDEENTFVLETGSEASGKCFMKFDKQAIYQTDAVVDDGKKKSGETAPAEESAPAEEVAEEQAPEENTAEPSEEIKD